MFDKKYIEKRAKEIWEWCKKQQQFIYIGNNEPKEFRLETINDLKIMNKVNELEYEEQKKNNENMKRYQKILNEFFDIKKEEKNAKNGKKSRTIQKNSDKNKKNKHKSFH